tara:strand:- start:279 stop:1232 length:954 start_codon:yes stop_codon:yes gene_type:complete
MLLKKSPEYPKEYKGSPDQGVTAGFSRYPKVFYVETVLACNLACPECVIGIDGVERTKGIIKPKEFNIISKKIEKHAKLVYLHKWGEPTMNKNIYDYIEMVSDYAHVHISTNSLLLNEEKIEKLITKGCGTLIVSIDGFSQEVYQKYRVGGKVEIALRNLKLISSINKKYGDPVYVIPQFIVFEHNYDEIKLFQKFCEEIELIPRFKNPYIRYGDKVKPSKDPKYKKKTYEPLEHIEAIKTCNSLLNVMTITVNGDVILCSQDYNGSKGFIGNILDENSSVESIWDGEYFTEMRNKALSGNPCDLCLKNCTIYPPSN